jgi:hypothetical protein
MGPGSLLESGAGTGVNADELLSSWFFWVLSCFSSVVCSPASPSMKCL